MDQPFVLEVKALLDQMDPLLHLDVHYRDLTTKVLHAAQEWCLAPTPQTVDALEAYRDELENEIFRIRGTNLVWRAVDWLSTIVSTLIYEDVKDPEVAKRVGSYLKIATRFVREAQESSFLEEIKSQVKDRDRGLVRLAVL